MNTAVLRRPILQTASTPQAAATGFWRHVWAGIERHGQRRAAAELRRVAAAHGSSDPQLARQMLAAAERLDG